MGSRSFQVEQQSLTPIADDPLGAPKHAPVRQSPPNERLFVFLRGLNRFRYELRDDGPYGVTAQFFLNERLLSSRRFETRTLAVQWAEEQRMVIFDQSESRASLHVGERELPDADRRR
jgi:hypothetical protein